MLKIDARLAELRAALETEADAEQRVTLSAQIAALESANALLEARKSKGNETVEVTRKRRVRATLTTTRTTATVTRTTRTTRTTKRTKRTRRSRKERRQGEGQGFAVSQVAAQSEGKRADEDESDEEDDEDDAAATLAALYQVTGHTGKGQLERSPRSCRRRRNTTLWLATWPR